MQKFKKIKKPNRLNVAMWKYFILIVVLLVVFIELVVNLTVTGVLESQLRMVVSDAGRQIVATVSDDDENKVAEVFRERLEDGVNSYLFSENGELLISSDNDADIGFFEISNRISTRENVVFKYDGRMYYAARANFDGSPCVIAVSVSRKVIRSTINRLQLYLGLTGLVTIGLTFFVAYMFSQRITNSIKSISDKAVKLAEGDYTVDFSNADYAEIAHLSDSLNYVRDEVKKSGDFQREIISNVTHDLKTPLTMIKAYASMIQEISGDNPQKRNEHLKVIIDEADRLTGLVNDILSVSKVSSNVNEISPKVFNLTEFVYGIISKFGYLQQSMGYSIMVDIEPNLYTRADEEKIGQVIYNLVSNAVNYTGEDKTVYVSLKSSLDGKRIKFTVRDTGKGISPEELPNIWERYYRSEDSHVRAVKGTGLGLNIVKAVLKAHNFDFGVESEKGKGATFWVDFPAVPSTPDGMNLPETPESDVDNNAVG